MIVRCCKAAQRGKHFIDRHEDLRKAALTDNRCDLVKRVRSVSVKLADSRADQLLHTSVAAQFSPISWHRVRIYVPFEHVTSMRTSGSFTSRMLIS